MNPTLYVVGLSIAFAGFMLTVFTSLSKISYNQGHVNARVEELEKWRVNMRNDMHEISDGMQSLTVKVDSILTLIDERTERRSIIREPLTPRP